MVRQRIKIIDGILYPPPDLPEGNHPIVMASIKDVYGRYTSHIEIVFKTEDQCYLWTLTSLSQRNKIIEEIHEYIS